MKFEVRWYVGFALDDEYLHQRLRQIMVERQLKTVVETGLAEGHSTVRFCRMAERVIGIDILEHCIVNSKATLAREGCSNYQLFQGDSPEVIQQLVASGEIDASTTLFFIDAHAPPESAVRREIAAIPRGQGVLAFHDFKCPGRDFRWDDTRDKDGNIVDFEYEVIADVLTDWSPTHRIEYMTQAMVSYRGAGFAYPS